MYSAMTTTADPLPGEAARAAQHREVSRSEQLQQIARWKLGKPHDDVAAPAPAAAPRPPGGGWRGTLRRCFRLGFACGRAAGE